MVIRLYRVTAILRPHCLVWSNVTVILWLPAQINLKVRICYTSLLHIENSLYVLGTVLDTI